MEIRCSRCSRIGVAAGVEPVAGGVGLVCAGCGHVNVASVGEGVDGAVQESGVARALEPAAGLIPEPGEGPRCRKCLAILLGDAEFCPRCGLSIARAARFAPGEAPWEVAPPGKEAAHEEGRQLWTAVVEAGDGESLERFVDLVLDEDLIDFGIFKLQKYLIKYPGNPGAIQGLGRLSQRLERMAEVARSQAEVAGRSYPESIERMRHKFFLGSLVVCAIVFVVLAMYIWVWS